MSTVDAYRDEKAGLEVKIASLTRQLEAQRELCEHLKDKVEAQRSIHYFGIRALAAVVVLSCVIAYVASGGSIQIVAETGAICSAGAFVLYTTIVFFARI